jgi:DNA-binding XRE family transcriptional regulator
MVPGLFAFEGNMPGSKTSSADKKRAQERAAAFKAFRRRFLFSQGHLAIAIWCSRRTIAAIEGEEIFFPGLDLLRRFEDLKRRHEQQEYEDQQRTAQQQMYAYPSGGISGRTA